MTDARTWTLHQEPFRHYKATNDNGKDTWNGAHKQRIVSVTDVLDGGQNNLTSWAIGNALVAAETAMATWFPAVAPALASSTLDFGGLAEITGLMPDSIRDNKADLGTLAHRYFAGLLCDELALSPSEAALVPYGFRVALHDFMTEHDPVAVMDERGPLVERTVGDFERAIAGTYDAVLNCVGHGAVPSGRGRWDLKSSNTVQPKHFAQVAEYEELAVLCGEKPSDYVGVLHITPLGDFKPYTIQVGSPDYVAALAVFNHYLGIKRGESRLAKLLK